MFSVENIVAYKFHNFFVDVTDWNNHHTLLSHIATIYGPVLPTGLASTNEEEVGKIIKEL